MDRIFDLATKPSPDLLGAFRPGIGIASTLLLVLSVLAGCGREADKAPVTTAAASPSAGRGPDWPMFRGNPTLTGVTPATVASNLTIAWMFDTQGAVSSSPAVVGDRVYIGSASSNLFALRLTDGQKLWSFTASGPIEASPLVLDGRVFIGDINTNFYALDAATGQQIWRFGLEDKVKSSANWVTIPSGKAILVGGYDYKLYSLNPDTGRTNWVFETSNYINGTPAVGNGLTAFGGCDAIVHVVDVITGQKKREIDAGAYIAASGALVDGHLYVGHYENEVLNVDLEAGVVVWKYRDRSFPYFSSPAVTTNRVLFGGRDKRLHCVDRATGKAIWTFATRGKVDSSPVVAGDDVFVGSDDGRIYRIGLGDGQERWNYEVGQPVQSSAAVVAGYLLIGSDDGKLYCFH